MNFPEKLASPLKEPAHLDIPGNWPPEISLNAEVPPTSSNGTGAFLKEIYFPSV
jgi:hypothetical protein